MVLLDPVKTLIVPGKVKVDLANCDIKFWTNSYVLDFYWIYKKTFLQKRLPNLLNF